jgi:DNA-binding MarR family transcriptional regulator
MATAKARRTVRRTSRTSPVRIAYTIGRLERALRRCIGAATAAAGLTVAQYTALSVLRTRGELSNAELAQRSLVSPQAMNEIIQLLTGKGIVERRSHPAHGRIVHITLTALGERLWRRCDRAVLRLERSLLGGFSPAERQQLPRLLRRCLIRLEAEPVRRASRAGTRPAAHLTAAPSRTTLQAS